MMESFQQLSGLGWLVVDVTWKSTVILLLVSTIDRLLLRRRPIAADTVWLATVIVLALLPLCCWMLPRVSLSVPQSLFQRELLLSSEAGVDAPPVDEVSQQWGDTVQEMRSSIGRESERIGGDREMTSVQQSGVPEAIGTAPRQSLLVLMVAMVYLLGGALGTLRFGKAYLSLQRLHRNSSEVPAGPWTAMLDRYRRRLSIRRQVRLLQSTSAPAPLTMGWQRPVLILPSSSLDEDSEESIRVVLLHELTHIARNDYPMNLITKLVECLYWYNPLVWLASRRIRHVREAACDGYCIASLGDREGYVRVLLDYAQRLAERRQTKLGLTMIGVSRLENRLASLTPSPRYSAGRSAQLATFIAASLLATLLGMTALAQSADDVPDAEAVRSLTIADIVAGLQQLEQSVESLAASYSHESHHNLVEPGRPLPPEMLIQDDAVAMSRKGTASWEMLYDGRGRMEAEISRTNFRFDGSQVVRKERHLSVFDGNQGSFQTTHLGPNGTVLSVVRQATDRFMRTSSPPFDFATQHLGKPISDLVTQKDGKIVGYEQWEGRPVIVVEVDPVVRREDYIFKQKFWVDPGRNFLAVRRESYVQRGEGKPWGLHLQIDLTSIREVVPGIWLPKSVNCWNHVVTESGQGHLVSREHFEVSKWSVNAAIDESRLQLDESSVDRIGRPLVLDDAVDERVLEDESVAKNDTEAEVAPEGFRYMRVRTVDEQGNPVPETGLYVSIWPDGPYETLKREYVTDEQGQASVLVPQPPRLFRMWTQKAGFVPLFAQWWPEHQADGFLIPQEFTFTMPSGTKIGGAIHDEEGLPIEGVIVEVMLANRIDEMNRRPLPSIWLAEVPGPGKNPRVSDASGKWSLDNVPSGEDIYVRLKLTHPDYVSDAEWGELQDAQAVEMESLRNQSAVLVMKRGD